MTVPHFHLTYKHHIHQVGGYENNPVFIDSEGTRRIPKDFAFGLFELDYDVFGVHIEGAVNRVPCLEQSGIKSTVCGPESFTPDHKPIMGEDPMVRGLTKSKMFLGTFYPNFG